MSEKEPTEYRGRTVLVKTGENSIEPLITEGISTTLTDLSGTKTGEYVGHTLDRGYKDMVDTRSVASETLTPESQADFARELSALPLRGDTVNGLFDGKIVDVIVGDHKIDETSGNTVIEVISKETGLSKWADVRAFSPEIQAKMKADKESRNAKMGKGVFEVLDVGVESSQTSAEETIDADKYSALLRGEVEGSVEDAAVRPVETEEEKSLRKLQEYHQKQAQNGQIQTGADFYRAGHK